MLVWHFKPELVGADSISWAGRTCPWGHLIFFSRGRCCIFLFPCSEIDLNLKRNSETIWLWNRSWFTRVNNIRAFLGQILRTQKLHQIQLELKGSYNCIQDSMFLLSETSVRDFLDFLDSLFCDRYRSTKHRVLNTWSLILNPQSKLRDDIM